MNKHLGRRRGRRLDATRAELLEALEIDWLLADELPADRADEVRACWSAAAQAFAADGPRARR